MYPFLKIDDFVEQLQGACHLSKIDLKFGYHQLRVRDSDILKTSFRTRLTTTPVLTLPKGSDSYVIYCHASGVGLGCVLMEREKYIAYASRQLKVDEKKYLTHDLEIAIVVFSLKANVVVDGLKRLSMGSVAHVEEERKELARHANRPFRVKEKQVIDPILLQLKGVVHQQKVEVFSQEGDGVLHYQGHLCIPKVGELGQKILIESHNSRYSIHPGATKIYRDLREVFWWNGIKRDIANFVAKCQNCQHNMVEHQKPGGMTQEINIPTWKWEVINMDLITGLPRTRRQHDSIWVIVDRVIKFAHFLVVKSINSMEDYAKLYINEMVKLHGIPLYIISDRGPQFTSHFWYKRSWDDHLPLIEFTYIKNYHSSIQIALYEAIYRHRCRSLVGWFEVSETTLIGSDSFHEAMEKVQLIRYRLKARQSRQKSYADVQRRDFEFEIGNWVFLKVSPLKGVIRFEKKWKFGPRYVCPYIILKRVGKVAYEIELLAVCG
ncbi:hypothetical protein MTR67_001524 [Solanum verrucosum]|uniref:Integrase catalytic domain-containing protein n=1 Tax=Solanum verrucosum TaxID=315347 RepID=A0AAF0T7Y3_SOLVR|nr:hypothetical protein MTR67_001524 [Solanum verrucosum]